MCLKNGLCFYNKEKLEIVHEKIFLFALFNRWHKKTNEKR
ncbi:hypothetical protein TF3313_0760 [Tannerella forsythia 3313]|nr:hypothetical protein TF3313_0760 [Tannerella forsythia 3313]